MARALTIKQPWAHLIVFGGKRVENRSWPLPPHMLNQTVYIHASGRLDRSELQAAHGAIAAGYFEGDLDGSDLLLIEELRAKPETLTLGRIIGKGKIVRGLPPATASRGWRVAGQHGFVFADVAPCTPIEVKGALNFWEVPAELERLLSPQEISPC